jgi:hypothetical protein
MLTIALRVTCCIGAAAVVACREPSRDHDDVPSSFRQQIEDAELESRRAAEKLRALPEELDERGQAIRAKMEHEKERLDRAIMDMKRATESQEAQLEMAQAKRSWSDAKHELDDAVHSFGAAWHDYDTYFQHRVEDVLTDARIDDDAKAVKEGRGIDVEFEFKNGDVDMEGSRAAIERMIRFTNVCPTARFTLTGTGATKEEGEHRAAQMVEALRTRGAPVARIVEIDGAEGDGKAIVRVVRTCS